MKKNVVSYWEIKRKIEEQVNGMKYCSLTLRLDSPVVDILVNHMGQFSVEEANTISNELRTLSAYAESINKEIEGCEISYMHTIDIVVVEE